MSGHTTALNAGDDSSARVELKNAHDAIRIVFAVIMAIALKRAFDTVFVVEGAGFKPLSAFTVTEIVLFFVFVVTIARFFMGDMRHLDTTYLDPILGEADDVSTEQLRPINRFLDFYLLLIHGIIFYYMATLLSAPRMFFGVYVALILFNAVWLVIASLVTGKRMDVQTALGQLRHLGIRPWLRAIPPQLRWAINNTLIGLAMLGVFALDAGVGVPLFPLLVALAILNAAFDYLLTWEFYFPPIEAVTGRS